MSRSKAFTRSWGNDQARGAAGYRAGHSTYFVMCFVATTVVCSLLAGAHCLAGDDRTKLDTRAVAPQEATELLEHDWLFQADDMPTVQRIQQEIEWARQIAGRWTGDANAPNLTGDLDQLIQLEQRLATLQTPVSAGFDQTAYPRGLVTRWTFDGRQEGRIDGCLGDDPTGRVVDRASFGVGAFGEGLMLDGQGLVATDATLPAPEGKKNGYSVCLWVRTSGQVMDVLGSGIGPGQFLVVVNRGPVRGHHWTDADGNVLDGNAQVNDGRWHHVAQVVDQRSISIFVDGKLDVSAPLRGNLAISTDPIQLGARSPTERTYNYHGCMDEVCLFDRALGADELLTIFERGKPLIRETSTQERELYLAVRRVKRRIMLADPLIDFSKIAFVDVPCYDALNHESMHRVFPQAQNNVGRLLVLDGLSPSGRVRDLSPGPGMFWRPDVSFDGRRVLFCYRPEGERTFHLYDVGVDGVNQRQITHGDYDDLDPIYSPDGHIVFLSNRGNSYARCAVGHPSYVLARCDADGKNLYLISAGNEPEYTPALMPNGQILYTRWEYTDKELFRIQSLWTVNPDGTGTATFWGNQSYWPDMLVEARPIPGSPRVMFSGQGHHDIVHGAIGIIDPNAGFNYPDGLTKVTLDRPWAEVGDGPDERPECPDYHTSGNYDGYRCPFPLSDQVFLVSARMPERRGQRLLGAARKPESRFGLYLMDVFGNRELIYRGIHDVLYAMPVRPRPQPPILPDTVAWPGLESEGGTVEPGVLFSANVFEGLAAEVAKVTKFVRVVNLDYTTFTLGLKTQARGHWGQPGVTHMHAGPPLSITGNDGFKRVLGTVPIEADGSICIEVPPCKQLHLQLLDEHYRAVHTMRSFTNVMPGERRGCIGCHESHGTAPPTYTGLALQKAPRKPTPPPWGPHYNLGYERDIQPILDRYCGSCHQGDGEAREELDLTLRPSADGGTFPEPYVTLTLGTRRQLRDFPANCEGGVAGTILPMALPLPPQDDRTLPPMTALSYTSRLVELAMSGEHYDVTLDELSLRKLIAWVDILCPYLGEEEIRAMPDPDPDDPFFRDSPYPPRTPGVRPFADSPYPPRMRNAPIVNRAFCQDEFSAQADRLR